MGTRYPYHDLVLENGFVKTLRYKRWCGGNLTPKIRDQTRSADACLVRHAGFWGSPSCVGVR